MSTTDLDAQVEINLVTITTAAAVHLTLIGAELFMCIYGLFVALETPKNVRKGLRIYVALSFILCFLDIFYGLPIVKYMVEMLRRPKSSIEAIELDGKLMMEWFMVGGNWAQMLHICIADGLLIYRCFVVWIPTNKRIVTMLPASLYVAFVVVAFIEQTRPKDAPPPISLRTAYVLLTAGVNCTVTVLIAGHLLYLRRRQAAIRENFDSKLYMSVIAIVAESALPIAIVGLMWAICYAAASHPSRAWRPWTIAQNVSGILLDVFIALSPQLIIFRVTIGRSFVHSSRKENFLSALAFRRTTSDSHSDSINFDDADAAKGSQDHESSDANPTLIQKLTASNELEKPMTEKCV